MSEKFTKGPWFTHPGEPKYVVNQEGTNRHVAMVSCYKAQEGDDVENVANAHLVAAAPELYAAVKMMCSNGLELGYCTEKDCCDCKSMAALKKARGDA